MLLPMLSIMLVGQPTRDFSERLTAMVTQHVELDYVGHYLISDNLPLPAPTTIILLALPACEHSSLLLIRNLRTRFNRVKILGFSEQCDLNFVRAVIRAGINGYMWQDDLLDGLVEVLRSLESGKAIFSSSITKGLLGI